MALCNPCAPYIQVCMTLPPPILAPTSPDPVEPLKAPCPITSPKDPSGLTPEEKKESRYDNFWNGYNMNLWHIRAEPDLTKLEKINKSLAVAVDGQDIKCKDKKSKDNDKGCPTGFKMCGMIMKPSANGTWCAKILPCPPKRAKRSDPKYC